MKKVFLLQLLTVFVFTISGFNQEWDFTYSYAPSIGYQIIQTNDSNFVVTEKGSSLISGSTIKLNKFGEIIWIFPHGGYSIQETFDGGYIVAGDSSSQDFHDATLLKLNSNGIEEWYFTYGNISHEKFEAVIQDSESNFVACGTKDVYGNGGNVNQYIVKTNNNGDLLWEKNIPNYDNTYFEDLIEVNNFYYIVGFIVDDNPAGNDIFYFNLFKLNQDGSTEWAMEHIASWNHPTGWSIALTSDSSLITTGGLGLIKIDLNGNIQWEQSSNMWSHDVESTGDNGFILAGNKYGSNCLIKVDSSGSIEWEKFYTNGNSTFSNYFLSVNNTFDQGYIACGCSKSDMKRLRIVKTDGSGNITGEIELLQPNFLKIYPNPTNDIINIESSTNKSIEIFDINGRLIISKENSNNSISLGSYPPGIYCIKIKTESGIVINKIIKL